MSIPVYTLDARNGLVRGIDPVFLNHYFSEGTKRRNNQVLFYRLDNNQLTFRSDEELGKINERYRGYVREYRKCTTTQGILLWAVIYPRVPGRTIKREPMVMYDDLNYPSEVAHVMLGQYDMGTVYTSASKLTYFSGKRLKGQGRCLLFIEQGESFYVNFGDTVGVFTWKDGVPQFEITYVETEKTERQSK